MGLELTLICCTNFTQVNGFLFLVNAHILFLLEFTIRLYHNTAKDDPLMTKLCQYSCQNDFVDLCYINQDQKNVFPMLWRFFPTMDPNVDLIMSRDLDSRFTAREAAAVREWLASNKTLHAMRDHPFHGVPIMGGGWGSKLDTPKRRYNIQTYKLFKVKLYYSSYIISPFDI